MNKYIYVEEVSVDDDNVDQNEVEMIILEKTKNKLYKIFLKQCKNTNLKRRSYTPDQE